jgi:hypothetical protein
MFQPSISIFSRFRAFDIELQNIPNVLYFTYVAFYFLILLMLQLFGLTCGLEPRSDGFCHTDSAPVSGMIIQVHPQGYAALKWESILHGNAGVLGDYKELAVLPDKIARYLYEFYADCYASHGLPPLPDDRSNTNVHGISSSLRRLHTCH